MASAKAQPTKLDLIKDLKRVHQEIGKATRDSYEKASKYKRAFLNHWPNFKAFAAEAGLNNASQEALDAETQSQLLHYKAKASSLESSYSKLLQERGKNQEIMAAIKTAIVALEPFDKEPIKVRKGGSKTPIAAVIKLSDWQIGEVIQANETEGFGEFNHALAEARVQTLVEKVLHWVQMHRDAGYNIRELHIFSEADLVSGNIHYELEVTNEFPVTVAAAKAGRLLAETVAQLAVHFDLVKLWEMNADNHGRMTRKNQGKQGALNNWSYIAHTIANVMLEKHKNVQPIMGEGTKLLANVLGKKFLLAHGHHIMGSFGIPYYGLDRDKARESLKRAKFPDKMFDYLSMGHWHVPAIIGGNILINGSLPGTTEFDHLQGRHCGPAQVSFMVHPTFGLFNWTSWKL